MELSTIYATELDYISAFFGREGIDFNESELLTHIDLAWRAIARYMWIDYNVDSLADDKSGYEKLIETLALAYYNNAQIEKNAYKGNLQITQQSQGSRSVTYKSGYIETDANGLTAEVKAALPVRKLRVL